MKSLFALALALPLSISAGAALAGSGSFTGNWSVKAKLPPGFGKTGCLMLVDNGSAGATHSGPVMASGDLGGSLSGTFEVVNNLLVVNLQAGSETGEVVFFQFIAAASNGRIHSDGVYNDAGFSPAASFALAFGEKGSC